LRKRQKLRNQQAGCSQVGHRQQAKQQKKRARRLSLNTAKDKVVINALGAIQTDVVKDRAATMIN
jgi:hypothetical protein